MKYLLTSGMHAVPLFLLCITLVSFLFQPISITSALRNAEQKSLVSYVITTATEFIKI